MQARQAPWRPHALPRPHPRAGMLDSGLGSRAAGRRRQDVPSGAAGAPTPGGTSRPSEEKMRKKRLRGRSAGSQVPAAHQTPRPQAAPPGPRCTGPSPARPGRWVLGGTETTTPVAWARPSAAHEPSPAVRGAGRGRYLEDATGPDTGSNWHRQLLPPPPTELAPSRESRPVPPIPTPEGTHAH